MSRDKVDHRRILSLSFGHATIDFYENLLPPLLPFLVLSLGINYTLAGLLVSIYAVTGQIIQPILGWAMDRRGRSWLLGFSLIWAAITLGMVGWMPNYVWLIGLAALSGLGNALFHPLAALFVKRIAAVPGTAMALWSTMGNLGVAMAPLAVTLIVGKWGLSSTPFLAVPGLVMGLLFLLGGMGRLKGNAFNLSDSGQSKSQPHPSQVPAETASTTSKAPSHPEKPIDKETRRQANWALYRLSASAFLRLWALIGLTTYLPLYYLSKGHPPSYGGYALTLILWAAALATLAGGYIGDRIGRRAITLYSMILAAPVLGVGMMTSGWLNLTLMTVGGALLMAPHAANIVHSQEIMPERAATASAFILGVAGGLAFLLVVLIGALADRWHMGGALTLACVLLPLGSAVFARGLPETLPNRQHKDVIKIAADGL